MAGAPDSIYNAQVWAGKTEKYCREAIDELIEVLVKTKDLQSDLRDCEDFEEGADEQLRNVCEKLIQSIEVVRHKLAELEGFSRDLLDTLGFIAEYDEHREQWYLEEEIWSSEK